MKKALAALILMAGTLAFAQQPKPEAKPARQDGVTLQVESTQGKILMICKNAGLPTASKCELQPGATLEQVQAVIDTLDSMGKLAVGYAFQLANAQVKIADLENKLADANAAIAALANPQYQAQKAQAQADMQAAQKAVQDATPKPDTAKK